MLRWILEQNFSNLLYILHWLNIAERLPCAPVALDYLGAEPQIFNQMKSFLARTALHKFFIAKFSEMEHDFVRVVERRWPGQG